METTRYVDAATGALLAVPQRTRHIYAGIETIEEYALTDDGQGGETATLLREFVWGDADRFPEPVAMITHGGSAGGAGGTAVPPGASVYHYLRDALGSVVALTDAGDPSADPPIPAKAVERYTYDPYGGTYIERWDAAANGGAGAWVETGASALGNPFAWTAQRYDSAVGLYAFWFRTYSPTLGRWLQRDPLGYVDGVNLYAYANANPLFWLDPLGLQDLPWWVRATDRIFGRDWHREQKVVRTTCTICDGFGYAADIVTLGADTVVKAGAKRAGRFALKAGVEAAARKAARRAAREAAKAARRAAKRRATAKPKHGETSGGGPHQRVVNERRRRRAARREQRGRERVGQQPRARKQQSGHKKKKPAGADRGGRDPEEAHRRVKEGTGGGQRPPRPPRCP